jgi:hypothetical protein
MQFEDLIFKKNEFGKTQRTSTLYGKVASPSININNSNNISNDSINSNCKNNNILIIYFCI